MKKNKGFTLIELLAVIVILGILMTLAVVSYSSYLRSTRQSTYENFEGNLKTAAENYLIVNLDKVPVEGGSIKITATELINDHYLDDLEDPVNEAKTCNANSYVRVVRNTVGEDHLNYDLDYEVCLKCSDYESDTCN